MGNEGSPIYIPGNKLLFKVEEIKSARNNKVIVYKIVVDAKQW